MVDVIQKIKPANDIKCAGVVILTSKGGYETLSLDTPICTSVADTQDDLENSFDDPDQRVIIANTGSVDVNVTNDIELCICDMSVGVSGGFVGVTGDVSISASENTPAGLKVDNREVLEMQEQILAELIKQNIHLESITDEKILDVDIETQGVV